MSAQGGGTASPGGLLSPGAPETRLGLALRYTAFAAVATLANLAAQRLVLGQLEGAVAPGWAFAVALGFGTGVGLVVKYVLDKRWIFGDRSRGLAAHGRRFGLYTLMGVATTAIFWGTETAFWLAFGTDAAREAGAVIGLAIGYVTKYRLDRAYVFRPEPGR